MKTYDLVIHEENVILDIPDIELIEGVNEEMAGAIVDAVNNLLNELGHYTKRVWMQEQ